MGDDSVRIDPWSSNQSTDYARIIDQFGLSSLDGLDLPNATKLHRRGIVFAHRDLDVILGAHQRKESFGVLTGLMPEWPNASRPLDGHRTGSLLSGDGC